MAEEGELVGHDRLGLLAPVDVEVAGVVLLDHRAHLVAEGAGGPGWSDEIVGAMPMNVGRCCRPRAAR